MAKKGKIFRKGYVRKAYTKQDGTKVAEAKVPGTYVKDVGLPGKTPEYKRVLPKLEKGELSKYGYKNIKELPKEERQDAIDKAVKAYTPLSVYKKLNAVRNYIKNTSPKAYKKMGNDMKYIKREYGVGK